MSDGPIGFIRKLNPIFVLLFPLLVLPAMLYYMVRPWILMDDLVERNIFVGVPIYNKEAQKEYVEQMAAKKIADQKEFDERSAAIEREEAAYHQEHKEQH